MTASSSVSRAAAVLPAVEKAREEYLKTVENYRRFKLPLDKAFYYIINGFLNNSDLKSARKQYKELEKKYPESEWTEKAGILIKDKEFE